MPFTFPTDNRERAGAVRPTNDGNNFYIPVVIFGADGVTPISFNPDGSQNVAITGSNNFKHGIVDVPNKGTKVRLPDVKCTEVTIIAKKTNTGKIYIGNSSLTSTNYAIELDAGESVTLPVSNVNLAYIGAGIDGEGVTYVSF
ncbi:hypothetical protein [Paenibacillus tyrfis]|uniref:hypothetical protein n=1 Tax=Paenibacillus tyrfis TaxID=1501230 RepID=UPI00068D860C|nr:hypothetical protein [Paenibacillus tyrfis]